MSLGARTVAMAVALIGVRAGAQSAAAGKDIYGTCAGCHGGNGEGGKQGEYPRLAGQPAEFLVDSLRAFQRRERANLPMFPYTEPRELSEADMGDVATYLASIELPTRAPTFKSTDGALDRLLAMERVLVVPKVAGDVEAGRRLMREQCASCHGATGRGRPRLAAPRLVGQYPSYLRRQLQAFQRGLRGHEAGKGEGVLTDLTASDVTNVLAFLTAVQDAPDEPTDGGQTEPAPGRGGASPDGH